MTAIPFVLSSSTTSPRSTQPRSLPLSFIRSVFRCVKKVSLISSLSFRLSLSRMNAAPISSILSSSLNSSTVLVNALNCSTLAGRAVTGQTLTPSAFLIIFAVAASIPDPVPPADDPKMNSVVISGIFALTSLTSTSMLSFSSAFDFFLSLWQPLTPMKWSLLFVPFSCANLPLRCWRRCMDSPQTRTVLSRCPRTPLSPRTRNFSCDHCFPLCFSSLSCFSGSSATPAPVR